MTIYRYYILSIGLIASLLTAHAQTFIAKNTQVPMESSGMPAISPHNPKVAESPFYVKVYGFYSLLTPGSQRGVSTTPGATTSITSFKTNTKGLGAGPRAGIGIGIIVNEFINIGLDADMLFGDKLTTASTSKTSSSETRTTFSVVSIIPNITFKALSRPGYFIYNRVGLIGGVVFDYKINQNAVYMPNTVSTTTTDYTTNYQENSLAIGYQVALGVQFRFSQGVRGFAELVAYNQSFKPKERLYLSVQTQRGGNPISYKSLIEYNDEGDYTTSTRSDGTYVSQQPSTNVVMNSLGLSAGLLFRF
ncbi:hypothetical protein [Spirosoma aerolatum]|uniref:hypothetical protein n=1 Tax=Spirosoma aerolatum TaxID=1211326 RepID=UPI0009ADF596|nr:hypothetical protein [Spirosoma aerolatum]